MARTERDHNMTNQEAKLIIRDASKIINTNRDQSHEARDQRAIAYAMIEEAQQVLASQAPTVRPKPGVTSWEGGGTISYLRKANNMHTKLICLIRDDRRDQDKQAG